jgi:hypothetical protein
MIPRSAQRTDWYKRYNNTPRGRIVWGLISVVILVWMVSTHSYVVAVIFALASIGATVVGWRKSRSRPIPPIG